MSNETLDVVQDMFKAWESLDMKAVLDNWHEDGYLWSMMNTEKTQGHEKLSIHLDRLMSTCTRLKIEVQTYVVSEILICVNA